MKKRNKQPVHAARGYHSETGCCGRSNVLKESTKERNKKCSMHTLHTLKKARNGLKKKACSLGIDSISKKKKIE